MSLHAPSAIKPLPGYRLWMRFADGTEGTADLSALVEQGVFQPWKTSPSFFDAVAIAEDGSLVWGEEIDLCSDALYLQITGKSAEDVFPRLRGEALHA